jgi:hypothetical protein
MRVSGSDTYLEGYSGSAADPDTSTGALVPTGSRALAPSRGPGRSSELERPAAESPKGDTPDANRRRTTDTVELQKQNRGEVNVRHLERMRLAGAARYARSGLNCEYRLGLDGRIYEVGSGVVLDVSSFAGGPPSTVTRREHIGRTALAPAQPSVRDDSVASRSLIGIFRTRQELISQQRQNSLDMPDVMIPSKGTYIDIWV